MVWPAISSSLGGNQIPEVRALVKLVGVSVLSRSGSPIFARCCAWIVIIRGDHIYMHSPAIRITHFHSAQLAVLIYP